MARYEDRDRWWEIVLDGCTILERMHNLGTTLWSELPDRSSAEREVERRTAAKVAKGYQHVAGRLPLAPPVVVDIHRDPDLEQAIRATPDDPAPYLVYADWLIERGDPRGELITLQHAMRGQQDPATFMMFKRREEELRARYLEAWIGPPAAETLHRVKLEWRTGFVAVAQLDGPWRPSGHSLRELVAAVLASPIAIALRELVVRAMADELVAAVPEDPPRGLARLRLRIDHASWPDEELRARNRALCDRYREHGIAADLDMYVPEGRYTPPDWRPT